MEIRNWSNGRGLGTKTKESVQPFTPVVGKNEPGRLFAGKVIDPLTVDAVGNFGTVASLRITEFLHGGVDDWGEEDALNVDEHVTKLRSSEPTFEVLVCKARHDPR
jgi:hypothetical protein